MRYGIFSDIHSNLEALEAAIEAYQKEAIDKYLCLGDVVGYATNPRECIDRVREISIATLAGNHDWAAVNLFLLDYFNPAAREAIFWTRRNLDNDSRNFLESLKLVYKDKDFTLVHSTLDDPGDFNYMTDGYIAEETFRLLETNICFVGHTHVARIFIKDRDGHILCPKDNVVDINPKYKYIVNVGSVGQTRDGIPKAVYCVYDTDKKEVQIKGVDYDIQTTRKKIIDAGLPRFLGDRLLIGR